MAEFPAISKGDKVIVYTLPNLPSCMRIKDALNLRRIIYKTVMMDTPEGITELRANGCSMQAPVLQVNDTFYEKVF